MNNRIAKPIRLLSLLLAALLAFAPAALAAEKAEGETVTLELFRRQATDTTAFQVENMFPGDSVEKTYYVNISYKGSVTVHFHADIQSGYDKLAEVLQCEITLDGSATPLYKGRMRDMPTSLTHVMPESAGTTATLAYGIRVYLDTSVGNDYMSRQLKADFRWWVDEEAAPSPTPGGDTPGSDTPGGDSGGDTSGGSKPTGSLIAKTGDASHALAWAALAALATVGCIVLMKKRRGGAA